MRTLIQGGWVVGFQKGHHAILRNGVVVIEDDRILHVGPHFDGTVEQTINASGKLVSPGFVNIHAVANIDIQTLTLDSSERGLASSRAYAVDNEGELELSGERLAASARFSLVQLLKGGSTTIVESTTMAPSRFEVSRDEVPLLAQAAIDLGARIYLSHKFRAGKRYGDRQGIGRYHWDENPARAALNYGCEVVKRYEGTQNDRLRTMIFPYQFDACTPELLRAAKDAAKELNVPLHMHTSQTLFEFHDCLRRYGRTPIQLLNEIDFLDERTILTHVIYTSAHPQSGYPIDDGTDLQILADRGAHVAHCPVVYARRDRILGSFARYREMGVNVPLGTDTFPQDMIEEMRWTALGCKWIDRDANRGTARAVFNAATLNGARALGRDDIGRLTPGAKADIIIVDFTQQHIGPVSDPIKTLIYAASGTDIETILIDGRVVVKNGAVPGVNEAKLLQQATEAHLWQRNQFVVQHPSGKSMRELFPAACETVSAGVKSQIE